MAGKTDNVKTNMDVTAPGKPGASVETVFIHTTYDNSTDKHMNYPQYSRETKSGGEDVISSLPCPV